jgi:type I restriction enzyme S subunit
LADKWPKVPFGELLKRVERFERKDDFEGYTFAGTYSFGRGIFVGERKKGMEFRLPKVQRVYYGDFVYCKIMAWEGAFGVVPKEADNCVLSGAFVVYEVNKGKLEPGYLDYYFRLKRVWEEIGSYSTGTNVRRRSLHPDRFEEEEMVLPPLDEQRRIVARLDEIMRRVEETKSLSLAVADDRRAFIESLLRTALERYRSNTVHETLNRIVELERRPVGLHPEEEYSEIGIYSYGRGIFHKQPRIGFEFGNKKLHRIKSGDLVFQITFAWEGAIALAGAAEDGMYGSVRYPTFRVNETICDPAYLLTYLLSAKGIRQIGKISPGSAGRNRVLSVKRFAEVKVPVLPLTVQKDLIAETNTRLESATGLREALSRDLALFQPSILDRAFRGEF